MVMLPALLCTVLAQIGPNALPANASNVRYAILGQGTDLRTNSPGVFVFNEGVRWQNYWQANHQGPMPALEQGFFNNWRLVAIHAGNRPGEGYGLGVQGIRRRVDRATIGVVEVVPARNPRARGATTTTSPWILLRVERGAYDFDLQTQQVVGYPTVQTVGGGGSTNASGVTIVKVGGATVIIGPGGAGCPK